MIFVLPRTASPKMMVVVSGSYLGAKTKGISVSKTLIKANSSNVCEYMPRQFVAKKLRHADESIEI